jgi:hypothetical protein
MALVLEVGVHMIFAFETMHLLKHKTLYLSIEALSTRIIHKQTNPLTKDSMVI